MKETIKRRKQHSQDTLKLMPPSLELRLQDSNRESLRMEVVELTLQLRQMRGEDIGGLTLEELQKLEEELETGLCRVLARKLFYVSVLRNTFTSLGCRFCAKLMEENGLLRNELTHHCSSKQIESSSGRNQAAPSESAKCEREQSSELTKHASNSGPPHYCCDCSDTSLRLGNNLLCGK
ncbi:unnamed protein product [Spirodela intermedia]|uniref:K-box domain-containing protein n=1 Tax=Spirodela intermedia TaxID=51605 RepID=A0A7I8JRH8_SPIIN|nr:unnamed protein product [Spirodela intermedia]CAA6672780.1 unnamed protein product [Spirodela intermedia]